MAPGVRSLFSCIASTKLCRRNIMMNSAKLEKALEKLENNPYYEKYSERISALQKSAPEEFRSRVERRAELPPVDTRQFSSVLHPKPAATSGAAAGERRLDDILRTELVADKDAEQLGALWREYHLNKEVIAAAIPAHTYERQREAAARHPAFLFPLPRAQGYEFFLCQSAGHSLHFTPLLAYQVHKENAPECLTIVHYPELKEKGVVLMRGEYDKNVLSGAEARCLADQFQLYYCGQDKTRSDLLAAFTSSPDTFSHMALIRQLENITLV